MVDQHAELGDLREMLREVFDERASSERVRAVLDSPEAFDADLWRTAAELDLIGLLVPEEFGGVGAGLAEISVVLHELGRRVVRLPFISSAVLAPVALLAGDNATLAAEMLPALAGGQRRCAVVFGGPQGQPDPATWTITALDRRGHYILDGTAGFVLDAPDADDLIVAARGPDGVVIAAVEAGAGADNATVDAAVTTDRTRRLGTVAFSGVPVSPDRVLARGERALDVLARLQSVASFSIACDAAAVAERAMDETAAYAQVRYQFGRAIGSFQAIKHKCANMAVSIETSKAALSLALDGLTLNGPSGAETSAVSTAKAYVCDSAVTVCTDAVQAHGGIGFTWEHDAHLWLKRALLDRALFGSPSWHRRRVADVVLPPPSA